jgi:putative ABC transport system substrate-binding protein
VIDRRTFLAGTGAVLLAAPLPGEAQPAGKVPRIALLFANTPTAEIIGPQSTSPYVIAFLKGMRDLGWVDGQNIIIERRSAEGQPDRFPALVNEVVGLNVALMMITGPPSAIQQAQQARATMPIVLAGTTDPENLIRLGLIKTIARPGGSVTGLTTVTGPEIRDKRLQLLKDAVPKARRVAYLGAVPPLQPQTEATARALKLTLLPVGVPAPRDFEKAFAAITRDRVDALFLGDAGFFWGHRHRIIEFAARQRLPAMYTYRIFAESGGLMAYGTDYADLYRRAATYVDKILKGAKPGDLPIEQPTKFELVINLKTAKALGLTIPPSLLGRADEVIQ